MARSDALFGVSLFLMGFSMASSGIPMLSMGAHFVLPILILTQIGSMMDLIVSVVGIIASKKYGPKSLIASCILSGLNTILRAALTLAVWIYFFSSLQSNDMKNFEDPIDDATRVRPTHPEDLADSPVGESPQNGPSNGNGFGMAFMGMSLGLTIYFTVLNLILFILSVVHASRANKQKVSTPYTKL